MKLRITSVLLVVAFACLAGGGSLALASHFSGHHAKTHRVAKHKTKKHNVSSTTTLAPSSSSVQTEYSTRPGKGCGDRNHVHTGPPGNPSNTSCPPTAGKKTSSTSTSAASKAKHHGKRTRRHGVGHRSARSLH